MSKFDKNKFYCINTGEEVFFSKSKAYKKDYNEKTKVGVINRKFYNEETGKLEELPREYWRYGIYSDEGILAYVTEPGSVILIEKDCKRIIRNGKFGFKIVKDRKIMWTIPYDERVKLRKFASSMKSSAEAHDLLNHMLDNWIWTDLYLKNLIS